jgi:hypothetical protein
MDMDDLLKLYSNFMNLECENLESNFAVDINYQQLKDMFETQEIRLFCHEGFGEKRLCCKCRGNIDLLRIIYSQQKQIAELKQEIFEIKNNLNK